MAQIDHVAEGIYRISSYAPTADMTFNQFLIDDEHPTLIHTGTSPVESRKLVPPYFGRSLVRSYPSLSSRRRYDLLQKAELLTGRRAYARAQTNNRLSDPSGDQRVCRGSG
jgi:hypothetical protein